jgi:peroxiredoxin
MKKLLASLLALVLVPALAGSGNLRTLDGAERDLDSMLGGGLYTVVMFWASDCHVCNQEMGQYVKFHQRHQQKDARMVGISLDGWGGREAAREFIARHKVNFENLITDPDSAAGLYQKLTEEPWVDTPTFLIYLPDGSLAAKQVGAVPVDVIEGFMAARTAQK